MKKDSQIQKFFSGKSVFITGSTGFLGSVLLEKLLRCCPGIKKVYVLIREKKGVNIEERFKRLVNAKLFCRLEPEFVKEKLVFFNGDMTSSGLGLSEPDKNVLKNEVSIVFHSAATTNFGAHLRQAIAVNLQGTEKVLQLAHDMKNLQAFVYISTAYCNAVIRGIIAEDIYPSYIDSDDLIGKINQMTDEEISEKTSSLLGGYPTTYSFTKHMCENLIDKKRQSIPVAVIRPSVRTMEEPISGWVENVQNGGVAFIAGAGKGIFRTVLGDNNKITDFVPCDMVASLSIASAWDIAKCGKGSSKVYHCTTGTDNPITLNDYCNLTIEKVRQFPCSEVLWYPGAKCRINPIRNYIFVFLFHLLPGYLISVYEKFNSKNRPVILYHKKFIRGMAFLYYFTIRNWHFDTKNTRKLESELCEADKEIFNFDVRRIKWPQYMEKCVLGVRHFYHGDHPGTIEKSRNLIKLYVSYSVREELRTVHYGLYLGLFLFVYYLLHLCGLKFWTTFFGAALALILIFWL